MEVIKAMGPEDFKKVCKIGADIVSETIVKLREAGIPVDQIENVMAVAMGGVIKITDVQPENFSETVEATKLMWNYSPDALAHDLGLKFNSAIPEGTAVRKVYITDKGRAALAQFDSDFDEAN